eukprot:1228542-Lingulodinium_polyedra.AAC.1
MMQCSASEGANDTIKPYCHQWWVNMKRGKSRGTAVNVKVAGHSSHGAMTEHGEVLMYNGQPKTERDIGWVLPICRLQDELGAA